MSNFMQLYHLKNLVKENTCFKSIENTSCVDHFLTKCSKSFQNTFATSTGISDFHKMTVTVLESTFKKVKPKEIIYRAFRNFDRNIFNRDLESCRVNCQSTDELGKNFYESSITMHPRKKRYYVLLKFRT